jgi:hypothetical protein
MVNPVFFTIFWGALSSLGAWFVYVDRREHNKAVQNRLNAIQASVTEVRSTIPQQIQVPVPIVPETRIEYVDRVEVREVTNWEYTKVAAGASFVVGVGLGLFLGRARYRVVAPQLASISSHSGGSGSASSATSVFQSSSVAPPSQVAISIPPPLTPQTICGNNSKAKSEALNPFQWKK